MSTPRVKPGSANRAAFPTTHWSVVVAAGRERSPQGDAALETLAQDYWYPIYAFLRREGYAAAEAQDLTQAFFARLLEKNYPAQADREKGRFRSFLLLTLRNWNRISRWPNGSTSR